MDRTNVAPLSMRAVCSLSLLVCAGGSRNRARAEGYAAGYLGTTHTRPATVVLEQSGSGGRLAFRNAPFSGQSFQSPVYYGYRGGYYFSRHFGVEAEFIHLKIHADLDALLDIEGVVGEVAVSHRGAGAATRASLK